LVFYAFRVTRSRWHEACDAQQFTTRSDIFGALPWFASLPSLARKLSSEREWNSRAPSPTSHPDAGLA
jgi:hypothetical protein